MMHNEPKGRFAEHYRSKIMTLIGRQLRSRSTRSEDILWQALRRKQLSGLKFRRQHPFGSSIVDFYCHEKRLVIEIDGGVHVDQDARDRDRIRQEIIELYDVQFLRFTASEVEDDLKSVLKRIKTITAAIQVLRFSLPFRGGTSQSEQGEVALSRVLTDCLKRNASGNTPSADSQDQRALKRSG